MQDTTKYPYPTSNEAPLSELEKRSIRTSMLQVCRLAYDTFTPAERRNLYKAGLTPPLELARDSHALSRALMTMRTAHLFASMIDPDRNLLATILLSPAVGLGILDIDSVRAEWGDDVASLVEGYLKVSEFASRGTAVSQDNFRGLLLSLARDIRIIIIMIVESLVLMRTVNHHPHQDWVRTLAFEANCLYAQLAHRLGLYKIKGELEDLVLSIPIVRFTRVLRGV